MWFYLMDDTNIKCCNYSLKKGEKAGGSSPWNEILMTANINLEDTNFGATGGSKY